MEPMKLQRPTKPTLGRQFEFQFPASMLRSEAHAFLGDIAGADGKLDAALEQ